MLKEINPGEITLNPFKRIDKDWCLITAGNEEKFNTMTASWAGLGILWSKKVATCYIRPQRYTKEFVDNNEFFTLTFFPDGYREALTFCGRNSGKNVDKVKETGLTPWFTDNSVSFKEADLVLVCRKLYAQDMKEECFVDKSVSDRNYPEKDWHTLYIGEIVKAYVQE